MKLLIVEDEKEISNSICAYFEKDHFLCDIAFDYHTAIEKIHLNEYVCVILDVTLPNGSGLDVLAALKTLEKAEGVIIISARNSLDDKIKGLETGADDYLSKPFHLPELGARVASIIRRRSFQGKNQIIIDRLVLDLFNKSLKWHDQLIPLTRKEYDLLLYFIGNKNRVITKEAIVEHLWGNHIDTFDNYDFIYAHIKNLRKKLIAAGCPDYLKVAYGLGYKFSVKV